MSLFKQLFILIALIFLVIFTVNFITGVNNIRTYLETEAEIHAQDTATSLGLSLSPHMGSENDPLLQTMINTIFDRGYYRQIRLVNAKNEEWVNVANPSTFEEVPDWFVSLLPMKTATASTEISSGWTIAGELFVTINPGYAYLKLYQQAKRALFYSLIAYIFFNLMVYILLHFILTPLKKIEQLAKDIANGKFSTIEQIPVTTEIKSVTLSMNYMSGKIKNMIESLNEKLDKAGQQMQRDELTKLKNKSSFDNDLKNKFITHAEGYVFFIRIDNLGSLSKDKGREYVDNFLKEFAKILEESTEKANRSITSYRFFGSEFAMLAEAMTIDEVELLGDKLREKLSLLGEKYEKPDLVHIGIVPFDIGSSIAEILSSASEAYEKAHLIGSNAYVIHRNIERIRTTEDWKELVTRVTDTQSYEITLATKVVDIKNVNEIVMEEIYAKIMDGDESVQIGTFISIAEKYNRISEVDKGIIEKAVRLITETEIKHLVNINLSMSSIRDKQFIEWLGEFLTGHQSLVNQLVFSITAYSASKDIDTFERFSTFAHKAGAKIMLKRYESQFIPLDKVKLLNPDYLRLAKGLTTGISNDSGKQRFVEAMKQVSDLLDTKVIAESVETHDDFEMLKSIGIYGASR